MMRGDATASTGTSSAADLEARVAAELRASRAEAEVASLRQQVCAQAVLFCYTACLVSVQSGIRSMSMSWKNSPKGLLALLLDCFFS